MADRCRAVRRPDDTPLSALGLDAVEHAFLSAARFFMLGFCGDHAAWQHAVLNANAFFPGPNSAATMQSALRVVQTMRVTRRGCFHFSNPRCPCCAVIVTGDERHLVQMLQHARRGQHSRAAASALLLCEGRDAHDVLKACQALAQCADAGVTPVRP